MYTQQRKLSCWPSCIIILMQYFGYKKIPTEKSLRRKCWVNTYTGTLPRRFKTVATKELQNMNVHYSCHTTKEQLSEHLRENPAMVLHMVDRNMSPHCADVDIKNQDPYGLHYAVATGIQSNVVTIHNPFGYIEEIDIDELRERMSFDNQYVSWQEKVLLALGMIRKHTVFFVKKRKVR